MSIENGVEMVLALVRGDVWMTKKRGRSASKPTRRERRTTVPRESDAERLERLRSEAYAQTQANNEQLRAERRMHPPAFSDLSQMRRADFEQMTEWGDSQIGMALRAVFAEYLDGEVAAEEQRYMALERAWTRFAAEKRLLAMLLTERMAGKSYLAIAQEFVCAEKTARRMCTKAGEILEEYYRREGPPQHPDDRLTNEKQRP
jgi:hypothetical protein